MGNVTPTRAERNNNPGNLNYIQPGHAFNGQVGIEIIPVGVDEKPRFGRYDTMFNGDRAAVETILIDVFHHELLTTRHLIGDETYGWAPGSDDNDDASYGNRVISYINAQFGAEPGAEGAFTLDTDLRQSVSDPHFLSVLSMGMYIVENGHEPVGMTEEQHDASVTSAMQAQGILS